MNRKGFVGYNQRLSNWFDRLFVPQRFSVDGLKDYRDNLAPKMLKSRQRVYDVGGGKTPFVSVKTKQRLQLIITGLDIDASELTKAPRGIYDHIIVGDVAAFDPQKPAADLVICQAVLEHVRNVDEAIKNISAVLKSGGQAALFIPSRNGLFARLNMILPERLKRFVLFKIFPETKHAQGFPAYYNRCTPKAIKHLCEEAGLSISHEEAYFYVSYFSFFFPLHLCWRLYQLLAYPIARNQCCEAFTIIAYKA